MSDEIDAGEEVRVGSPKPTGRVPDDLLVGAHKANLLIFECSE